MPELRWRSMSEPRPDTLAGNEILLFYKHTPGALVPIDGRQWAMRQGGWMHADDAWALNFTERADKWALIRLPTVEAEAA